MKCLPRKISTSCVSDAIVLTGQSIKDDELIFVVLVDLWSLATTQGVFEGKRMKAKLLANAGDLVGSRVDDVDPERRALLGNQFAQILDARVGNRPSGT